MHAFAHLRTPALGLAPAPAVLPLRTLPVVATQAFVGAHDLRGQTRRWPAAIAGVAYEYTAAGPGRQGALVNSFA